MMLSHKSVSHRYSALCSPFAFSSRPVPPHCAHCHQSYLEKAPHLQDRSILAWGVVLGCSYSSQPWMARGVLFPFRDGENVLLPNFKFSPGSSISLFGCPDLLFPPRGSHLWHPALIKFLNSVQQAKQSHSPSSSLSSQPPSTTNSFLHIVIRKKIKPFSINDWK